MIFLPAWNNPGFLIRDVLHLVSSKQAVVITDAGETCVLLSSIW